MGPASMRRYYFDLRDGEKLAIDEEGVELPDIEAVQFEAARSLADMAREAAPPHGVRALAIEVRDASGPILKVLFTFEKHRLL